MKEMFVKCRCGLYFDLIKAEWCDCKKAIIFTKKCPQGHCICHKLNKPHQWRVATLEEQKYGFGDMLKEEFGGVKE